MEFMREYREILKKHRVAIDRVAIDSHRHD